MVGPTSSSARSHRRGAGSPARPPSPSAGRGALDVAQGQQDDNHQCQGDPLILGAGRHRGAQPGHGQVPQGAGQHQPVDHCRGGGGGPEQVGVADDGELAGHPEADEADGGPGRHRHQAPPGGGGVTGRRHHPAPRHPEGAGIEGGGDSHPEPDVGVPGQGVGQGAGGRDQWRVAEVGEEVGLVVQGVDQGLMAPIDEHGVDLPDGVGVEPDEGDPQRLEGPDGGDPDHGDDQQGPGRPLDPPRHPIPGRGTQAAPPEADAPAEPPEHRQGNQVAHHRQHGKRAGQVPTHHQLDGGGEGGKQRAAQRGQEHRDRAEPGGGAGGEGAHRAEQRDGSEDGHSQRTRVATMCSPPQPPGPKASATVHCALCGVGVGRAHRVTYWVRSWVT